MNNLLYDTNEKPKKISELLIYAFQMVLSVFVATVLISNVCGTPVSSGLIGGCIGTLVYQLFTKRQSPMFISNCGATCSAVIGALATSGGNNYLAVLIGGVIIFLVYGFFALLIKAKGVELIEQILPPYIVGTVTLVIGINLAGFIPTYLQVNGSVTTASTLVCLFTMLITGLASHYGKGIIKNIPFLIGLLAGYILSIILTITNIAPLVDFKVFSNLTLFAMPDFAFKYFNASQINMATIIEVVILFLPVSIAAICEHIADHKTLSNIINHNLLEEPGLNRTLLGDGFASMIGTLFGGLPNTSYGESIATIGFSKVASVFVTTISALMLGALAFIEPVQAFIQSIPSCCFAGCACILYGYIATSGIKVLQQVNFNNNKQLVVASVILTIGVSGVSLFTSAFSGVSLAMVIGVILNIILKEA